MYKLKSKLENHDDYQILVEGYVEWVIEDIKNIEKDIFKQSPIYKIGNFIW